MAQTGKEKVVEGLRFVPVVDTQPFVKERPENIVIQIYCMGKDFNGLHQHIKDRYIGEPYSDWLELSGKHS